MPARARAELRARFIAAELQPHAASARSANLPVIDEVTRRASRKAIASFNEIRHMSQLLAEKMRLPVTAYSQDA